MSKPVTVEQLMQAVSVLAAIDPTHKNYLPTDPLRFQRAYNFVRACQEYLPQLAAKEDARDTKIKERPPRWPDGPTVRFNEAAHLITGRSGRRAPSRFWRFLNEDANYEEVRQLIKDRGVPEKLIDRFRSEFARWDSQSILETKRTNPKKKQKKGLEAQSDARLQK